MVVINKAALFARAVILLPILLVNSITLNAAVLPEDRADALYHRFDGGGVVIDGPSILVRKSIKDTVSISAILYGEHAI